MNTGGYNTVNTLLSAFWVALGKNATYRIESDDATDYEARLFLQQRFPSTLQLSRPNLSIVFERESKLAVSSAAKVLALPQPEIVTAEVLRLIGTDQNAVLLFLKSNRRPDKDPARTWKMRIKFPSLSAGLEPRVLLPRA